MAADSVALSSSPPPTFPDSLSMVEVRVIDTYVDTSSETRDVNTKIYFEIAAL
jgi:hypothetical protein